VTLADVEAAVLSLDPAALAEARWFGEKGRAIEAIDLDEAFVLDDAAPHVLAIVSARLAGGGSSRYSVVLTERPLRPAEPGDGAWRALAGAMADGRAIAAIPAADAEAPAAALVCRPGSAMPPGISIDAERDLGADQSNTSVVLGEQVVLKAYRRLQPGLNPDLELTAYLTEEAGFTAVPPLAGFAEVISARHGTATAAIAQAYVVDGADLYESMAEALTAWILAPGEVTVEFATEVPADIGALTAAMHAALASADGSPEFQPRDATPAERRAWATDAAAQLERALAVTPDDVGRALRELAPAIADELTHLETLPGTPMLTRVHGDYHLGQILLAPDGYRIIDFEGEPTRSLDERRAHGSPLRDIASMLRSIDHVGRSARRRAVERNGAPVASPGLDVEGWLRRSRERFINAYRAGLREAGAPIPFDADLLRAFEIDKEVYEYIYAATWLPSWLWAPDEGMHGLFEDRA
jgi:maltose alpha-D-glucosyltransferase/alpha-amylase